MRVAVVGSRSMQVKDLGEYLPPDTTEIITGGAKGVDQCAMAYAAAHGIPCQVIRPDYAHFRRGAPLRRNEAIVQVAEYVLIFWDGQSRGTAHVIERCRVEGKRVRVVE